MRRGDKDGAERVDPTAVRLARSGTTVTELVEPIETGQLDLEERGLKADIAGSATEALNKLKLIPGGVDAVVIDLGLPDRRGDILLREIRALFPMLPVVLASGSQHDEMLKLAQGQSRLAVVGKPYTARTLTTALQSLGIRC
jgi:DNA-binding response OmpR family regulator